VNSLGRAFVLGLILMSSPVAVPQALSTAWQGNPDVRVWVNSAPAFITVQELGGTAISNMRMHGAEAGASERQSP